MTATNTQIGPLTTTNATTLNVRIMPMSDISAIVDCKVIARADDGISASWRIRRGAKRTSGGNVVLVGAAQSDVHKDVGAALWDCDLVADSDGISIDLSGAAATTISWYIESETSQSV